MGTQDDSVAMVTAGACWACFGCNRKHQQCFSTQWGLSQGYISGAISGYHMIRGIRDLGSMLSKGLSRSIHFAPQPGT